MKIKSTIKKVLTVKILSALMAAVLIIALAHVVAPSSPILDDTVTLHFEKPDEWEAPHIHFAATGEDSLADWPGVAMTQKEGNWYSYTAPKSAVTNISFNDGSEDTTKQILNISPPDTDEGTWFSDDVWHGPDIVQTFSENSTITLYYYDQSSGVAKWTGVSYQTQNSAFANGNVVLTGSTAAESLGNNWYKIELDSATVTAGTHLRIQTGAFGNHGEQQTSAWWSLHTPSISVLQRHNAGEIYFTGNAADNSLTFRAYNEQQAEAAFGSLPVTGPTAPRVTASPASGQTTQNASLQITLNVTGNDNPTARYTTDNTTPTAVHGTLFTGSTTVTLNATGKDESKTIKVFATNDAGMSDTFNFTYTLNASVPEGITIHVKDFTHVHYFNALPAGTLADSTWPGQAMTSKGGGWYTWSFPGVESISLVFSNSGNGQTADLSRTKGEWWYMGGWHSSDPDSDTTPPHSIESSPGPNAQGRINVPGNAVQVTLTAKDDRDPNPTIYYTINGTDPTKSSTQYTGTFVLATNTPNVRENNTRTIKAIAVDENGNVSQEFSFAYYFNIPNIPPVITPSRPAGQYDEESFEVNFTVSSVVDKKPAVYFTEDGTAPTTSSTKYTDQRVRISQTRPRVTVQLLAVDKFGNETRQSLMYRKKIPFERGDPREDSIYFLMTTRWNDGNPNNNIHMWDNHIQGNPDSDKAWRGDFQGIIDGLDYIKALGFNAIWLTPIVKNASGIDYHGYHAVNHKQIDPRYAIKDAQGNVIKTAEESYQELIDTAHSMGIKIYQDIVIQHTSNFGEENLYPLFNVDPSKPFAEGVVKNDPLGLLPSNYDTLNGNGQYTARVFALQQDGSAQGNSKADFGWHKLHWLGGGDWDEYLVQIGNLAGDCLDLNTENPKVMKYMREAYQQYMDMGVDGFRVDTVKHISRLTLNKEWNPLIMDYAKQLADGKEDHNFFQFGEVAAIHQGGVWYRDGTTPLSVPFYSWMGNDATWPWRNTGDVAGDQAFNLQETVKHYNAHNNSNVSSRPTSQNHRLNGNNYRTPDWSNRSYMDQIDFPFHYSFTNMGSSWSLAINQDQYYNDATFNVTYVDSHDFAPGQSHQAQRYTGGIEGWAERLNLMWTFRGIPCIYYGSEIMFKEGSIIDNWQDKLENTGRAYYGDNLQGTVTATDFGVYTASGKVAETLNHDLAQHIRRLNLIRREVPALSKGQYSNDGCSGSYAFKKRFTDETTDSYALVTINGGAQFTNVLNGTYVELITGTTHNVTNGSLSSDSIGRGNMRVYVLTQSSSLNPGSTHQGLGKIGVDGRFLR